MTWRDMLLCLLTVVLGVSVSASQARTAASDQEILMQLERDWDQAFHRNDVGVIANILAEEFIATYDDGTRADKAKELELAASFNQQVDSSTLDEFTVKVFGDTAVVWFTHHMTGPSRGRQLTLRLRYLDVFVLRAGRWQCVASQSTLVGPPPTR